MQQEITKEGGGKHSYTTISKKIRRRGGWPNTKTARVGVMGEFRMKQFTGTGLGRPDLSFGEVVLQSGVAGIISGGRKIWPARWVRVVGQERERRKECVCFYKIK